MRKRGTAIAHRASAICMEAGAKQQHLTLGADFWEGDATGHLSCEPSDELQESLGPSGPEIPKKSQKCLLGHPAPGSQKVWKKSRKSPKSLEKVSKMSVRDFFETFSRLFGTPGPEAPGDFFSDFLGISGPEGPRDSCSSSEGSQHLSLGVPQRPLTLILLQKYHDAHGSRIATQSVRKSDQNVTRNDNMIELLFQHLSLQSNLKHGWFARKFANHI